MPPLAAQPFAHCSETRIRSRVGFGERSKLPTPKYVPPKPALRSRRFVLGDDQVTCDTFSGRPSTPTASGETRWGSDSPGVAPVHVRQSLWASHTPLSFWREVICHVRRPLAFSNVRSEYSRRERFGVYNHFEGSPVFRL